MNETPTKAISRPRFQLIAGLAIAFAGILAYSNSFDGEFVWDDASSVLLHENVKHPSKFLHLFTEDQHAFGRGQGNFYRPLLSVSFMVDYAIAHDAPASASESRIDEHLRPFVFHVSSTAWHILAAIMLMALMTRMGAAPILAFIVPIIYVVHPLHTEAVAYISGRADSMSAAFMFSGLYVAVGWAQNAKKGIVSLLVTLSFFAAALLSKESAAIFPLLLLVCLLASGRHDRPAPRSLAKRMLPLYGAIAMLAIYVALRTTVLDFSTQQSNAASPLSQRGQESLQALARYVKLIFVPTNLHMEQTLNGASGMTTALGAVALLFILLCIAYGVVKKRRHIALGFAWFLISWLPISGLFPLNAPMAEHWLYVPLAGFLWALFDMAWPSSRLPSTLLVRGLGTVVAIWAFALLAQTIHRNRDWHDNESLYTATLRDNANSTRIHFNLAITYEDLLDNPPGARRHFEEVVRISKRVKNSAEGAAETYLAEELESHLSLGNLYYDQARYEMAAEHYGMLLGLTLNESTGPLLLSSMIGMGKCFLAVGDRSRATEMFNRAVDLEPGVRNGVQVLLAGGEFVL